MPNTIVISKDIQKNIVTLSPTGKNSVVINTSPSPSYVTDGLVLYLDASNASSYPGSGTTWFDLSGNNITGSLINGPTFDSGNGGSILFDGNDDYMQFSNAQLAPGTGPFTWNFWFKLNNLSNFSIIFSGDGSNTSYGVIAANPSSYGLLYYALGYQIFDSNTTFGTNWWYASLVGNGGADGSRNLKLYRNAVQAGSTYTTNYNFTVTTPRVGINHSAAFELMRGNIANVSHYNKALSSAEILQNFNADKSKFGL